jgi:hypothetical protein
VIFSRYIWNASEGRTRAPVRVIVGFVVIALFAVVGTLVTELAMSVLWPSSPFAYYLVGTTLGLGVGAVVGVSIVARYLDRRPLTDYGFRGGRAWWRDLVVGLGLATAVQTAVLGVELANGWAVITETIVAGPEGFVLAMVASLALFAVVALYEELVVRGFVLTNVAEGLAGYGATVAVAIAVAVSSLLFGVVHVANAGASFVAVIGIAVIAITLAVSYVVTGRLGLAIGFHAGWNLVMGVMFGHPVSGIEAPARILVVDTTGPATWTGGAFGPEAGLLGVLAALAGLVGVLVYARLSEGRIGVHVDLLVPELRGDSVTLNMGDVTTESEDSTGANSDVSSGASTESSNNEPECSSTGDHI